MGLESRICSEVRRAISNYRRAMGDEDPALLEYRLEFEFEKVRTIEGRSWKGFRFSNVWIYEEVFV